MAASLILTIPGVGDQIAAAVAESLKHIRIGGKGPSASSISEEVGKNVAAVLETDLSEITKPTFDASSLREHSLDLLNFFFAPRAVASSLVAFPRRVPIHSVPPQNNRQASISLAVKAYPNILDRLQILLCGCWILLT